MKARCILIITRCNISVLVLLSWISVNFCNCNSVLCSVKVAKLHYISLSEFLLRRNESLRTGLGGEIQTELRKIQSASQEQNSTREPHRQSSCCTASGDGLLRAPPRSRAARGRVLTENPALRFSRKLPTRSLGIGQEVKD